MEIKNPEADGAPGFYHISSARLTDRILPLRCSGVGTGRAVGVEANVLTFCGFRVNELTFVGFDVLFIFANAEAGRVVVVVVEDGGNAFNKLGVIRNLDNYITCLLYTSDAADE